jgi:hypothetical protein
MSTDPDGYPDSWRAAPHPFDPVLGGDLDEFRPTPRQRADVIELALAYSSREYQFGAEFLDYAADRYDNLDWPQAFLGLLALFESTAVGAQGERLTVGRLASALAAARDDALNETVQP